MNNNDMPQIFYSRANTNINQPVSPGLPMDVMPMLPDINQPVSPGLPNDVMPMLPDINQPVSPGLPDDVFPMLPDINQPVSPGLPNDVMPMLPSTPSNNIFPGVQVKPIVVPVSYMRFLHAAPSSPSVDVYVNGRAVARNLSYQDFTDYMVMLPGVYNISVYPAGKLNRPVLISRINITGRTIYTAAISGEPQDLDLELITDKPRIPSPNTAYVRFIHLSPNAPAVDVYVDGRMVIADIAFREVSSYLSVRPGRHSITLKVAGTNNVVLEDPVANLKNGNFYSVYVVGYVGMYPNLEVLIPLEGTSYLRM